MADPTPSKTPKYIQANDAWHVLQQSDPTHLACGLATPDKPQQNTTGQCFPVCPRCKPLFPKQ